MMLTPRVADISHHNTVHDMSAAAAAGLWGIIHKASQGSNYADPDYAKHRQMTLDAGMLWGAYHFNDASDVAAQVDHFLRAARPDKTTLLVIDYEDVTDSQGRKRPEQFQMSPQNLVKFLRLIEQKVNRKVVIYSGNRLREQISKLAAPDRAYVCSHPLWLCAYSTAPKIIPGFSNVFLWQYTDGHFGPPPHGMAGISGDVDLNTFRGTRADLEAAWISTAAPIALESSASSHSVRASEDDDAPQSSSRSDDDTSGLPPFMRSSQPTNRGLNVQPETAQYDVKVETVQRQLDKLGYHEVGVVNGLWGGKTAAAIAAFFNDRGIMASPVMSDTLYNAIADAIQDGWSRPITTTRANATPKDLAPKVEAVRVSLWGRFSAKVAGGAAALGFTGSSLSGTFQWVQEKMQPVQDMFDRVPGTVWFLLMGIVAVGVWYFTDRAAKATTKDYNTGRLN